MVRVFLLAVLSLLALVLVARALPSPGGQPMVAGMEADSFDPRSPFAPWDGVWQGTLNIYHPDGSLESSAQVRREHASLSADEQTILIVGHAADGRETHERGRETMAGERLERRLWGDDGTSRLLQGRLIGRAILWHREDPRTGMEETLREEILHTGKEDLYTIDGWGTYPTGGGAAPVRRVFEGRFRRSERDEP